MLTDKDLKDISDRCNKATNGPWKSFIEGRDHESGSDFIQTPDGDIELIGGIPDCFFEGDGCSVVEDRHICLHALSKISRYCITLVGAQSFGIVIFPSTPPLFNLWC